jgi:integrase
MATERDKRTRGQRGPTKRAKGEGAFFKRSDGLWIGRIDLGYDDDNRKIRVQVSAKDKDKAVEKLRAKRKEIEEYGFAATGRVTVKDWLTYWIDHVAQVRPNTAGTYRGIINNHIIPAIGRHQLTKLEMRHVRQMLVLMERKKLTSARRQARIILNKALTDAKAEGKVTRVVPDGIKTPNPKKAERVALSAAEARAVLRHIADDRLGSLWATYLLAGLRRGEGIGLTVDRVDLDRGVLDISQQMQRIRWRHGCGEQSDGWPCGRQRGGACPDRAPDVHIDYEYTQLDGGLYLVDPKSDKGRRMVPIVDSLHVVLKRRLAALDAERTSFTQDHGLLWPRPDGRPYDPHRMSSTWHDVLQATGVTDVDLHSARHTTATLLLEAGVDAHIIQAVMGHTDVVTTRGYQHVDLTMARGAMVQLERLIELES